jgi:hypothetical protein
MANSSTASRVGFLLTGALGTLALASPLLVGTGCEDQPSEPAAPSAAPKDVCVQNCQKHATCVLELREEIMGKILEGSAADVKKTAAGYAKQDAAELDAQCQKLCQPGADAKARDKISGCTQSDCAKLVSCMGLALPVDASAEHGPHACVVEAQSACIEYTGPELRTSDVKPACRALYEGKYEKATCPRADVVGSCEAAKGKGSERTTYYYSTGKKPHTAESAQAACVGDFKPANAGDAGAAASGSASAGPAVKPSAAPTAAPKAPATGSAR